MILCSSQNSSEIKCECILARGNFMLKRVNQHIFYTAILLKIKLVENKMLLSELFLQFPITHCGVQSVGRLVCM